MTVTFSEVTNRAGFSDQLTRFDVDSLFTFGIYSLGQGYIGEWKDDQTLVITITDPLGATPVEIGFVVAQVRLRDCSYLSVLWSSTVHSGTFISRLHEQRD